MLGSTPGRQGPEVWDKHDSIFYWNTAWAKRRGEDKARKSGQSQGSSSSKVKEQSLRLPSAIAASRTRLWLA